MIEDYSSLTQVCLATFLTWAFTAAGSAAVFVFNGYKRSFLDASLGFAAGVMTAASFWSLILPALEASEQMYNNKFLSLIPVIVGILLGAGFVHLTDVLLPDNFIEDRIKNEENKLDPYFQKSSGSDEENQFSNETQSNSLRQRPILNNINMTINEKSFDGNHDLDPSGKNKKNQVTKFRKIILLIIAVTVHNIPEGLAVGVGFGAVGKTKSSTFQNARNLALGIGIQNFPEGLAVSLPLYASGYSKWKSFWYGQLSGMVEPVAGILGILAVGVAQAVLPYALAFAAGAMFYVVFENLIPESASHGNGKLSTWFCIIGFVVMMSLDVGLS
ncbi:unnamed protein product [Brachionus calyciflorus]|uniref:Zinc transporter ZIP11 n=1 Tax=Brachionus calyciflorus TaxID=104777 RepID=A0A813SS47_9BILA|nr:unnamed protein product [Brachionus calyciflorus]